MVLTIITGFHKKWRHTHAFWAMLMVICFLGAMISGKKMVTPKKPVEKEGISEADAAEESDDADEAEADTFDIPGLYADELEDY